MLDIARGPANKLHELFTESWDRMAPIDHNGLRNQAMLMADNVYPTNATGQTSYAWHTVYYHNLLQLVIMRTISLFFAKLIDLVLFKTCQLQSQVFDTGSNPASPALSNNTPSSSAFSGIFSKLDL
jgi:hypothetical protein